MTEKKPNITGEICEPSDLHRVLRDHWKGNFIFRGEDSDKYSLRSKWGRVQADDARNGRGMEQTLFNEFRRRAAPFLTRLPATEWDWIALAQHHGVATRLLDWTENALVAAYFATRPISSSNRVLYMIDQYELDDVDESKSPFSIDASVIYRPTHLSARISSQGGLFTAHSRPAEIFEHPKLERWLIKHECCIDLSMTIESYGVDEVSIFRDLDSLARVLNETHIRKFGV